MKTSTRRCPAMASGAPAGGFDKRSLDDYVDVAERITEFCDRYSDGSLSAGPDCWRIVQVEGWDKNGDHVMQTFIAYTATAYRWLDDPHPGVGVAWEVFPGRTPYTRGSEVMTSGQLAEHTKLQPKRAESRPSTRLAAVPEDDPFYDQAAPVAERDYDSPGTITRDQQKAMHAAFGVLGIKDRETRLVKTREIL